MAIKPGSVDEILLLNISRREHNEILSRIESAGFRIPEKKRLFGVRTGHVFVPLPHQDHPTTFNNTYETRTNDSDCPIPVAYVHEGYIELVNVQRTGLERYHQKLRELF